MTNTGSELISGTSSHEQFYGGVGNDRLYGRDGNDIYYWNYGDGNDYIYDDQVDFGVNILQFNEGITPDMIVRIERGSVYGLTYTLDPTTWIHDETSSDDVRFVIEHPTDPSLSGTIVIADWGNDKNFWDIRFSNGVIWDGSYLPTLGVDLMSANENVTDVLEGDAGDDSLSAGSGDDIFIGGAGFDQISMGFGDDLLKWNLGDGQDFISWSKQSGDGKTIHLGAGITPAMISIEYGNTYRSAYKSYTNWVAVARSSDNEVRLVITHPNDPDSSKSGSIIIENGNNSNYLGYWQVTFEDSDQPYLSFNADIVNDSLNLIGTDGVDILTGGNGDDAFAGGKSNDEIVAGYGDDQILWNLGDGHDAVSTLTTGIDLNQLLLGEGITSDMITLEFGNQVNSIWELSPSGQDLRVVINYAADTSLSGSVVIDNWRSNREHWDIVFHNEDIWRSLYLTTLGNDIVYGSDDDDSFEDNTGDDRIYGEDGNDVLSGGQGEDDLYGGIGDDVLIGGQDNDILYGNVGNDTYNWNWGDGHDFASDLYNENKLTLGLGILPKHVTYVYGSVSSGSHPSGWSDATETERKNDLKVIIQNPTDPTLSGSFTIDNWFNTADHWSIVFTNETIVNSFNDISPGDDLLKGGDGDDAITAASGNDELYGGSGNDTLSGGIGNDKLYGESGDDTYKWSWGDGHDYIDDTRVNNNGENIIVLGSGITPSHLKNEFSNITSATYLDIAHNDEAGEEIRLRIVNPLDEALSGSITIQESVGVGYWGIQFTEIDPTTGNPYTSMLGLIVDADYDGLPDWWEEKYGLPTDSNNANQSSDSDSLTDLEEYQAGTNPISADTDGDTLPDDWEVENYLDPLTADADIDRDGDGLTNLEEYTLGTKPSNPDTDGDLILDGIEHQYPDLFDPLVPNPEAQTTDTDGDGYSDYIEAVAGTNPQDDTQNPDTTPPTGGDPTGGPQPPNPGPGGDSPTAAPNPLAAADWELVIDTSAVQFPKYGYSAFQEVPGEAPKKYLNLLETVHFSPKSGEDKPESKINGRRLSAVDPLEGTAEVVSDDQEGNNNIDGDAIPQSPILAKGTSEVSRYDDKPNLEADGDATKTYTQNLLKENTTDLMVKNGKNKLKPYTGTYTPGTPYALRDVSVDETSLNYQKVKFKIKWKGTPVAESKYPVTLFLVFTPEDDPETDEDESKTQAEIIKPFKWDGLNDESKGFEIDPDSERNGKDGRYSLFLLPVEVAPDVLAVNSDFDEGRIDPATGYAIPDCDDVPDVDPKTGAGNGELRIDTEREHLNKIWANDERVTDDMHKGWFGVNPTQLGDDFWDGATVTIRKLDKDDPETGRKESGQIRFYAKWGDPKFGDYYGIIPYDLETLAPNNLVTSGVNGKPGEGVYGSTSTIPDDAEFWMEGVRPGKITLEWRLQKGDIDVKHEQTFLVATQKSKQEWIDEVYYQLKLQTSIPGYPPTLDFTQYDPGQGFFEFGSGIPGINHHYIREIYYYYRQLFIEKPEEFYWAGMAKVAGASVYGGMADLQIWKGAQEDPLTQIVFPFNGGTETFLDNFLVTGNKEIFLDQGWAHHAYAASGIWAIQYVNENEPNVTDSVAWEQIDKGIGDGNAMFLRSGNQRLLRREQFDVMQQYYNVVKTLKLRPPPLGNLMGAVDVPKDANGLVNAGEWMSANATKNPIPGGSALRDGHPTRRLDIFADRWAWIENGTNGMLQRWLGTSSAGPNFNAGERAQRNRQRLSDAALPYTFTDGITLPADP